MKSLLRLLRYVRPEMPTLAAAYACMLLLALTTAFFAFLSGPALNFMFSGNVRDVLRTHGGELRALWSALPAEFLQRLETADSHTAIWIIPVLLVGTALIKGMAQTGQFYLMGRTSQRVLRNLRGDAFAALLGQSPAFFARRAHGDLVSRLTHDTGLIEQAFFYGCGPILRDTLSIVVLLSFCFASDSTLAWVTFITVPLAVIPLARFTKWLKHVSKGGQAALGDINSVCYEALAGVRVVQAFGNEPREAARLRRASDRYYREMLVSYFIRAVRTPTMETLGAVALAALLTLLGYQVQSRGADPAHYISFFAAMMLMYDPLKKLGSVSDYLAAGAAAAERLLEIVDLPSDIREAPHAVALPPFQRDVVFDNVSFTYGDATVLDQVSLRLAAGKMVALVGASGSGKTTMAHLLPRFYDVTDGGIFIDGVDIRTAQLQSLRQQISIVSQDTFLFNTSVADNIAYGRPGASMQAIRQAATAAYADEFIARLPQGYDTVIGERGVILSGGQRQRLAIARALLRDSPLLILDEATSALDLDSERFVQAALDALVRNRTTLVIAHRLSTVRHADSIAVLKDGRIIEQGHHDRLLRESGEYARLYHLQFNDRPEPRGDMSQMSVQ